MAAYEALLKVQGTDEAPISVLVDLTDDNRVVVSAGSIELGDWSRSEIRLSAEPDGFHLRAEGEEILLDITEDARFALDYGMRQAPPLLRRRMAAMLRDQDPSERV